MSVKMYTTSGIINFISGQKPGWFHVKVDQPISDYYHWFYSRAGKKWSPCLNGPHITFIAGNRETRIISIEEMKPYIGSMVNVSYQNTILTNGRAFWIPCECEELQVIRGKLGLCRNPFGLHITLGNIKNDNNNKRKTS